MATVGYLFKNSDGSISNVVQLFATVASIDLTATGQTTLYTVPTGKTLRNAFVIVEVTAATTFISAATCSAGASGGSYTEIDPLTALTGLSAVGNYTEMRGTIRSVLAAASVVKFNVGTGATATSLIASVYLFGILT